MSERGRHVNCQPDRCVFTAGDPCGVVALAELGRANAEARSLRAQLAAVEGVSACGGCGGPHRFDTSVPSVLWNRVIRPLDIGEYLCLTCIVREFAKAGISFTATLWGDGLGGLPIAGESKLMKRYGVSI